MVKEYQEPWPDDPGKALYAAIKRRAESYMLDYGNKKGCPVGVARIFAFCGAWLPTDQHFLIGNIIGAIEKNAPLEIKATVPVFRSYMSADSLSAALFELVSRLRTWQTVIVNVGSDRATEMHEFGIRLANDRRLACYSPDIGTLDLTRTDRYVPAISKLRDLTGLPQPVDLDVILSETLLHREQLALRPQ
jgi:nucleoside-diphosphate-sugar epimerase